MKLVVCSALLLAAIGALATGAAADTTFTDPTGDQVDLDGQPHPQTPDITTVEVTNTPAGVVTIRTTIANHQALPPGGALVALLDADKDASTGDDGFEASLAYLQDFDGTEVVLFQRYSEFAEQLMEASTDGMAVDFSNGVWIWTVPRDRLFDTRGFTFLVGGLTLNPDGSPVGLDVAPDEEPLWQYDLVGVAPPPPPRLVVSTPSGRPARPVAGRRFTVGALVTKEDMVSLVSSAKVTCTARVGNARVRATGRYRRPSASCTMTVPRSAKGKRLTGTMTIQALGRTARKPFRFRVG